MNLQKLKYYVTLVETGSFSRAANILDITQPALSWNIKNLEESLGTQLVKRTPKGLEITETGNTLYTGSKELLLGAQRLERSVRHEEHLKKRRINIGMSILSSIEYMIIFQHFSKVYPEYQLDVIQRGSNDIQQRIVKGELDIGIVSEPITYPILKDKLVELDDYYYEVAVVVPATNPLSKKASITLDMLKGEEFSMMSSAFTMGVEIEKRMRSLGHNPDIVFVNENWEVIIEHVAAYKSISFLPTGIQELLHRDDIVWVPLDDSEVSRFNLALISSLDLKEVENQKFFDRFKNALTSTDK